MNKMEWWESGRGRKGKRFGDAKGWEVDRAGV